VHCSWQSLEVTVTRFFVFFLCVCAATAQTSPNYHQVKKVPLGAAQGGGEYFDYLTFDPASRHVFVSHGTEVRVIDADNGKEVGKITGLKRCHGVALVPELNRGFISDGDAAEVVVFDLKTLKATAHIKADKDADSIIYDPASQHVLVFEGDPNKMQVIDPAKNAVIATVPLGGAPEQAVADGKGMVYDNLEDKNEVIAIDSKTNTIKSRWAVAPGAQPVSIAMDRKSRRLFIGCRNPKVMVVMDADTGKIIGEPEPIGGRVDTTVFDPETGFIALSTGEGTIDIFHEDSPDKVHPVQSVKTEPGAKTMALDLKTHNLYVDTAEFEPANPAEKNARPRAKPGTLHVLVYARE
jgi:YVTN family beta-propeller protein